MTTSPSLSQSAFRPAFGLGKMPWRESLTWPPSTAIKLRWSLKRICRSERLDGLRPRLQEYFGISLAPSPHPNCAFSLDFASGPAHCVSFRSCARGQARYIQATLHNRQLFLLTPAKPPRDHFPIE